MSGITPEVFTATKRDATFSPAGTRGILPRILMSCLYVAAVVASAGAAHADLLQLAPGEQMTAVFELPGFSFSNSATLPTSVALQLAGFAPTGALLAAIPGSSASYYPGVMMKASLESVDGSVVVPLFDADAWRLGMPTGDLVATATTGGGAMVYADASLSLNLSEALFGSSGQAEFVIQNQGSAFTVGLGPGYSISNAILAQLSEDYGAVQTGGYLVSVQTSSSPSTSPAFNGSQPTAVPEPAGLGVVVAGGMIIFWLRAKLKSAKL